MRAWPGEPEASSTARTGRCNGMDGLLSSQNALLVAVGVSATLAFVHLWVDGSRRESGLWVTLWAALAVVFQLGRWGELGALDPETAVATTRIQAATGPLLVATLVFFVRAITGRPLWCGPTAAVLGLNVALSVAAWATPWVVTGEAGWAASMLGPRHMTGTLGPGALLLVAEIPLVLAWLGRDILRAATLTRGERRSLLASLSAYALLGLSAISEGFGWPLPSLAEYGPVVMAVGLSHLLMRQRLRLHDELEALAADQGRALLESERRYRGLFEHAPIGIFSCDPAGTLVAANPQLCTMVGAPDEEAALGLNLLEAEPLRVAGITAALRRCIETGSAVSGDFRHVSRWGRTNDMRLRLTPIRDQQGALQAVLGLVEDVSERNALERQLRQAQKLESMGELAAGIAHEINNPMAYVRANLGVLREEWDALAKQAIAADPEARVRFAECEELIAECLEGVERTVAIASDMRDFAHSSGEREEAIALVPLLEGCVRIAATHRAEDVVVDERYGPLPPIGGAAGQLRQVFVNLIVNALQAVGERGRVEVTARGGDGVVRVRVSDDGPGVAPADRERVFDPFFTTKPAGKGTGLGLSVSYQIVRAHGGRIEVGVSPSGGACFDVVLPVAPEPATPPR